MSNFRRHEGTPARIALLSALLTSFIMLLSQRGSPNLRSPAQRTTEDVVSPIAQVLSYPIRGLETMAVGFKDRSRAFEENVKLRQDIAKLRNRQVKLDFLELKLARYEKILSTRVEADIPSKKIIARAVSETNGPFVRSLLLNVGRKDDVNIGNPVLTAEGLIGHIISAGQHSSRVLKLGDLNSRIPVLNRRSGGKAILSGDNSLRPKLAFTQNAPDWLMGDRVITSGDDGMLPMGLPVGVVVNANVEDLRVKLYSENEPMDWVWVSPYRPIAAPSDEIVPKITEQASGVELVKDETP